jgi:beta-mannosidase
MAEGEQYLVTNIDENWTFKQADKANNDFRSVAQFPTVIHLDLLHHSIIPEPSQDRNSDKVQWVGETRWLYRTEFLTPPTDSRDIKHVLVFDGLDTYAKVTLNGKEILNAANMFLQYRVDVTGDLIADDDGKNELTILFDSALLVGKRLEKEQGFKNLFWNGDSCRMNVRKIGCHFGWDW